MSADFQLLLLLVCVHDLDVPFSVLGGKKYEWQLVLLFRVNRVKALQFFTFVLVDQFLVADVVLQLIRKVLFFFDDAVFRVLSGFLFELNLLLKIVKLLLQFLVSLFLGLDVGLGQSGLRQLLSALDRGNMVAFRVYLALNVLESRVFVMRLYAFAIGCYPSAFICFG